MLNFLFKKTELYKKMLQKLKSQKSQNDELVATNKQLAGYTMDLQQDFNNLLTHLLFKLGGKITLDHVMAEVVGKHKPPLTYKLTVVNEKDLELELVEIDETQNVGQSKDE